MSHNSPCVFVMLPSVGFIKDEFKNFFHKFIKYTDSSLQDGMDYIIKDGSLFVPYLYHTHAAWTKELLHDLQHNNNDYIKFAECIIFIIRVFKISSVCESYIGPCCDDYGRFCLCKTMCFYNDSYKSWIREVFNRNKIDIAGLSL